MTTPDLGASMTDFSYTAQHLDQGRAAAEALIDHFGREPVHVVVPPGRSTDPVVGSAPSRLLTQDQRLAYRRSSSASPVRRSTSSLAESSAARRSSGGRGRASARSSSRRSIASGVRSS